MDFQERLRHIRVVLMHTSHPGNIGAAARALKTMGLAHLVLVQPKRFPDPQATALASSADDVLESARVVQSLDEALEGTVFSVAVSARLRDLSHPPLQPRAAAAEILNYAGQGEVALVFGNESAGLANEDVLKCSTIAHIPANPEYSSLNLAQAVQVLTYEVRMAMLNSGPATQAAVEHAPVEQARHEDVENFYVHLERSLYTSGFLNPGHPRRLMERLRRLFARARLEKEEVAILRGILTSWDERISGRK
jgi:tRNA/rRNA methyltransferase